MRRRVSKISTEVSQCPLYGISPLALSSTLRVPSRFAKGWKAELRANPQDAAAVARFINCDLGAFDPVWDGWICRAGLLFPPDSVAVNPAQVRAIPHMRAQLNEFERAQRWMMEHSYGDQQRERACAEAAEYIERAIEALRQR
jgi:hypothetical protein